MDEHRNQKKYHFICGVVFLILFLSLGSASQVCAAGQEEKVVRVGYLISEGYQEGEEGEPKSGYGYEYYQKIAYYTGWRYEYVYGGFSENLERLKNGEIDLMGNLTYLEDREEYIAYPEREQGKEDFYLYVLADDNTMVSGNYVTINKKKVGVNKDSYQEELLIQWCENNQIACEVVEYPSDSDCTNALNRGDIDAIVTSTLIAKSCERYNWKPVIKLGSTSFYIGVSKKSNPEILQQLEMALAKIQSANIFYNDEIQNKYLSGSSLNNNRLTVEEKMYIKSHSIRVGYLDAYMPLSDYDEKTEQPIGLMVDVLSDMEKTYDISFEYHRYTRYDDMRNALEAEEVDLIFPVMEDYWMAEEERYALSDSVLASTMTLMYEGDYCENTISRIAITDESPFQRYFALRYYPDSELVVCDGFPDVFTALSKDKAGSALVISNCYMMEQDDFPQMKKVNHVDLIANPIEVGFGFRWGDQVLLSVINKGIHNVDDGRMNTALINYSIRVSEYTVLEFLRENVLLVILVLLTVFVFVLGIILQYTNKINQNRKELMIAKQYAEEAAKDARKANAAKTDFLSRMSHDIRTPINGIMGAQELALSNTHDARKMKDYLEKIGTSAGYLLALVNDILDMSKLESGKVVLAEEPFDVREVVESCGRIISTQAMGSDVSVSFSYKGEVQHPKVIGSSLHVRQIILNIVSNAVKYNKPGGSVDTVLEEISCCDDYVTYHITVTDTGIGMSEEFQEHMFEAFSQESPEARTTFQGSGLGLAIVKRLIDQMDGKIAVESKKGEGSRFIVESSFLIDKAAEAGKNGKRPNGVTIRLDGVHVLLVEDNELNLEIVQTVLENMGAVVTIARNGQEAVDLYMQQESEHIDIILMDIMMPVKDGLTATKEIRVSGRPDALSIPIIAMTANAFAEDVEKCRAAGMNEHVAKPIDTKRMLSIIKQYTTSRQS